MEHPSSNQHQVKPLQTLIPIATRPVDLIDRADQIGLWGNNSSSSSDQGRLPHLELELREETGMPHSSRET